MFSARFDKKDENAKRLDEIELYINLNFNQILRESDNNDIKVRFQLEEIRRQELKNCGWRIDKINSMTIYFYKTTEMNSSSYVKIPLRSSTISNIQDDDKFCFIRSIQAHLHPIAISQNGHPTRASIYRHYFDELNVQGFDFSIGFKCSDVNRFEKLNSLSINTVELSLYRDQNN